MRVRERLENKVKVLYINFDRVKQLIEQTKANKIEEIFRDMGKEQKVKEEERKKKLDAILRIRIGIKLYLSESYSFLEGNIERNV